MENKILFRKLMKDGQSYCQIVKYGNFDIDKVLGEDYFYIVTNSDNLTESILYTVFNNSNGSFSPIMDDKMYYEIMKEFVEKYNDFPFEGAKVGSNDYLQKYANSLRLFREIYKYQQSPIDVINYVNKNIWYQEEFSNEIVKSIALNQELYDINNRLASSKIKNMLIMGTKGIGKNSIMNSIIEKMNIKAIDITLTNDYSHNYDSLLKSVVSLHYNDLESAEKTFVIVRDNYELLLSDRSDNIDNPLYPLQKLMEDVCDSSCNVSINNNLVTLSLKNITFIAILNTSTNELESLEEVGITDVLCNKFKKVICGKGLSVEQQKDILLNNSNSTYLFYKDLFARKNVVIELENGFFDYLLLKFSKLNGGMVVINSVIESMITNNYVIGKNVIFLSKKEVDIFYEELKQLLEDDGNEIEFENDSQNVNNDKIVSLEQPKKQISFGERVRTLTKKIEEEILGQDDQVRRLAYTILKNYDIANSNIEDSKRYIKNILLRGNSGTGKTAILTRIAKLANIPIVIADATRYTEAGFVGDDVTNMLLDLYIEAGSDLEKAEKGILCIDEIDKKASNDGESSEVSRQGVLNGLLKIVEGSKFTLQVKKGYDSEKIIFDTSKLTVISSGAFEGIEKIRDNRLDKKSIGFRKSVEEIIINKEITDDDYVSYGMIRQYMARQGLIVNLNDLYPKDLQSIMDKSPISELNIQKKLLAQNGITLEYQDDFLEELAKIAYNKKIGARGIERAFQEVLTKINIEEIDISEKYEKIIFNKECISDPSKIILIEKAKTKTKRLTKKNS